MAIDLNEHLGTMIDGLKSSVEAGVQGADTLLTTAQTLSAPVKLLTNPQDRRQAFKSLQSGVEAGLARIGDATARSILNAIIKPALTIGRMLLGLG